ncbi:MAG: DUF4294 domain-containing protein [Muribaculaceae bacterium]|nr:DUF4294 domain-containing protein [Muribaculaceae bacterium]
MSAIKRLLTILIVIFLGFIPVFAQDDDAPDDTSKLGTGKLRAYVGEYHIVDEETGDSVLMVIIRDVRCFPPLKFKNKKEEQFYWRTVRDVRKALPYAHLICETLLETYEYIETFPTQEDREAYLKEMEGALFKQYKPELKRFTRSQAKVLVKLIRRQTNQSSYDIVKAFLGGFRAGFWQMFGKLFGVSLKGKYNPSKDREDAIIERIACLIEDGRL